MAVIDKQGIEFKLLHSAIGLGKKGGSTQVASSVNVTKGTTAKVLPAKSSQLRSWQTKNDHLAQWRLEKTPFGMRAKYGFKLLTYSMKFFLALLIDMIFIGAIFGGLSYLFNPVALPPALGSTKPFFLLRMVQSFLFKVSNVRELIFLLSVATCYVSVFFLLMRKTLGALVMRVGLRP